MLSLTLKDKFPELFDDASNWASADDTVTNKNSDSCFKKYKKNELPWDLKVAMKHPMIPDSTIYLGGDMGHCVKNNRNNARLSFRRQAN